MLDIKVTLTTNPKEKPQGKLGFGKVFTDHMFVMNYTRGKGWHDPRIVPYQDITLSPRRHGLPLRPGDVRGPEGL